MVTQTQPSQRPSGPAPQRRLLAPGHGLQVLQRVHLGKAAAHGHAQRQVALPKVQRVVQHQHVCRRAGEEAVGARCQPASFTAAPWPASLPQQQQQRPNDVQQARSCGLSGPAAGRSGSVLGAGCATSRRRPAPGSSLPISASMSSPTMPKSTSPYISLRTTSVAGRRKGGHRVESGFGPCRGAEPNKPLPAVRKGLPGPWQYGGVRLQRPPTCGSLEPDLEVGQLRYPGDILAGVWLNHAELAVLHGERAAARPGGSG